MSRSSRFALAVVCTAALATGALLSVPPGPAGAAAVSCVDPDPEFYSGSQDIDANSMYDVVVGVPDATIAGKANAGAVDVHYRGATPAGAAQRVDESSFGGLIAPAAGDRFGTATSLLHLSGVGVTDECADLAIGAPGVNNGRGAVVIARGSTDGLTADQAVRIDGSTAGEGFGSAVVASDNDVWVGAPNRTVAGHTQAGAVYHYKINGTTATLVQVITENTAGVPGVAEAGDHFGEVLGNWGRRYLVVGQPSEDIGRFVNAGAVTVLTMSFTTGLVTKGEEADENSPGVSGNPESGDHFGASVSISSTADGLADAYRGWWVVVGVPGEGLGTKPAAGIVYTFQIAPNLRLEQHGTITHETRSVPGSSEAGDRFGAAVAMDGYHDVLIGVPGEDIGSFRDAGYVLSVTVDSKLAPSYEATFRQGSAASPGLGGSLTTGARVGSGLSLLGVDHEDLGGAAGGDNYLISIPGADPSGVTDAGEVVDPGATKPDVYTDSAGPRPHEQYGSVPYASNNGIQLS